MADDMADEGTDEAERPGASEEFHGTAEGFHDLGEGPSGRLTIPGSPRLPSGQVLLRDAIRSFCAGREGKRAANVDLPGFQELMDPIRTALLDGRIRVTCLTLGGLNRAAAPVHPHADDAAHGAAEGLRRHVDATAPDRLRHRGLGSRRKSFVVRQGRERRLAGRVREAADRLHRAPVEACGEAAEAGPPDATAFPWSPLRRPLADVLHLTRA